MTDYVNHLLQVGKQSAAYIKQTGIKNRFVNPYLPTMVVDNFYEDPDLWRDYALSLEFFKGDRGSWPGLRTKFLHELNQNIFHVTLRKLLAVVQQYGFTKFDELQTTFQYIDESYGRGWVHDDDPKLNIAGVIYLNPGTILGSGTTIYQDQNDFNGDKYSNIFMEDVLTASTEERYNYSKYREEQVSHFTPSINVESVYNRCIIFDPRCWHSAEEFFGKTLEDGRLTQVFFIKAS